MTGANLLALACRSGATAVFLMIAIVVLRDRRTTAARFGAALALAGAAYAVSAAPGLPSGWWTPLLSMLASAGPLAFWLWARATFDDDFVLRPWHIALCIVLLLLRLLVDGGVLGALPSRVINRGLAIAYLALALLAAAQTVTTWRNDLLAGRRRLRVLVLIGTCVFIAADSGASLARVATAGSPASDGNLGRGIGLAALALAAGWSLFRIPAPEQSLAPATAASSPPAAQPQADSPQRPAVDPALLRRLERLMVEERAYRREGLTIGVLAAMLSLPEYRLRQLINEGIGHRNFNAFLNHYRIEEAKTALGDPGQKDVPVLTIAMDAGFQSLGPFNRAFKADTGVTPTEFRRLALARAAPAADA